MKIHKMFLLRGKKKKSCTNSGGVRQPTCNLFIISLGPPGLAPFLCHGLVLCLVPVQPLKRQTELIETCQTFTSMFIESLILWAT